MTDKTEGKKLLTELLKNTEIVALDFIDKGDLDKISIFEVVLNTVGILWQKDLMDQYFNNIPSLSKPKLQDVNNLADVLSFKKDDDKKDT